MRSLDTPLPELIKEELSYYYKNSIASSHGFLPSVSEDSDCIMSLCNISVCFLTLFLKNVVYKNMSRKINQESVNYLIKSPQSSPICIAVKYACIL
jgi:hypothetical protein